MSGFTAEQVAVIYERQGRRVPDMLCTQCIAETEPDEECYG